MALVIVHVRGAKGRKRCGVERMDPREVSGIGLIGLEDHRLWCEEE